MERSINFIRFDTPLYDYCLKLTRHLTHNEHSTLYCIIKRTIGFNLIENTVSHRYIQNMTGIRMRHVNRALQGLKNKGLIIIDKQGNGKASKIRLNITLPKDPVKTIECIPQREAKALPLKGSAFASPNEIKREAVALPLEGSGTASPRGEHIKILDTSKEREPSETVQVNRQQPGHIKDEVSVVMSEARWQERERWPDWLKEMDDRMLKRIEEREKEENEDKREIKTEEKENEKKNIMNKKKKIMKKINKRQKRIY